ncbi:MAG: sigma-70 family RNA polymerase sigma factor [Ruminococcaceae bacterium]|nr:sigma-70 family RNA polymerase sigma factor [Oscillospiraceae bacterium]
MKGDTGKMRNTPFESRVSQQRLRYSGIMNREGWQRLLREDLTERQYQIMEMKYVRQMSQRDIAKQLDIAPSTVCRTLKRAEARMRKAVRYI